MPLITETANVPTPTSEVARSLATLTGSEPSELGGLLVGWAAGKAAQRLPAGSRIVRVVVVAETATD